MGIEELVSGGTLRPITRWGEPVMHARTRPVTAFDDGLAGLFADLADSIRQQRSQPDDNCTVILLRKSVPAEAAQAIPNRL